MADTDWITHRRPMEADGDGDGDVKVRYNPVSEDYSYLHWSHVGTGVPWIHCDDWKPSAPEPPTTTPRKFKETPRRTVWMDGGGSQAHTLDAIADDRARRPTPQPPAAQEEAWRWWAYHPEEGLDLYQTPEKARNQAIGWLDEDRSNAGLDGWHEEQEKVSWGYLVPIENAQITERRAATEDDLSYTNFGIDEIDEIVSYQMLPTTARRPTPQPPAEEEVAELVEWLRGECASEKADGNWVRMSVDRVLDVASLLQRQHPQPVPVAISGEEYHEDMGPVTWWRLPVEEPPWVGTPNDSDWPGYHTHFTPAPPTPCNAHALPFPTTEETSR